MNSQGLSVGLISNICTIIILVIVHRFESEKYINNAGNIYHHTKDSHQSLFLLYG